MQREASVACLEAYDRCFDRPHFGCDESYFEIFANLLHAQGNPLPLAIPSDEPYARGIDSACRSELCSTTARYRK